MLLNQQQCFIYSTASFLSKLRAKNVEKLHNSSFYWKFRKRNIRFRNRERLFPVLPIIKKKINPDRPTLDFFLHVTVNTHIFVLPNLMLSNEFEWINAKVKKCLNVREKTGRFVIPLVSLTPLQLCVWPKLEPKI